MKYKKLVRDHIPELIKANGEKPVLRKLTDSDFKVEINKKLLEEVKEFLSSKTKEEQIEELADIQEVLSAIYKANKIECTDVTKVARKKRNKKGGFKKKFYLEGVK